MPNSKAVRHAYYLAHREETIARSLAWRAAHGQSTYATDAKRDRKLRTHGWTLASKALQIAVQGGLCAIEGCANPATEADHDHNTQTRRGVLCVPCNTSLHRDLPPEVHEGRARYLREWADYEAPLSLWDEAAS